MCPHRDWFYTYKPYDGGIVLMGNDVSCKTIGIGSVRIKMFDGMVRTLTEVRHVLDLKKKLISLGELDSTGCKFIGQGGVLKVSKGAMIVMKAEKVGNLYKLLGNTVTGGAVVITKEAIDSTLLWHMRLGHMSEQGLKVLIDRKSIKDLKSCSLNLCEHCIYGKQCRLKFKIGSHVSKGILD